MQLVTLPDSAINAMEFSLRCIIDRSSWFAIFIASVGELMLSMSHHVGAPRSKLVSANVNFNVTDRHWTFVHFKGL
jgi:hypothetical protein